MMATSPDSETIPLDDYGTEGDLSRRQTHPDDESGRHNDTNSSSSASGASGASDSDDAAVYEAVRTWSPQSKPELVRIASAFERVDTRETPHDGESGQLERSDTLAGIQLGDPVLDPSKPEFNFYKWVRMLIRVMEQDGIKHRRTGITFKNLTISGSGSSMHYQDTVPSPLLFPFRLGELFGSKKGSEKRILNNFSGTVREGEMLIVLGRPGSGCSTFLRAMSGELKGLEKAKESVVHYNGVPQDIFQKELRGEAIYSAEDEKHFPHLTVGQTLEFAAAARTPSERVLGASRKSFAVHMAKVVMTVFGLSHTVNTKVGDDYVRGVSGGERKRVSISELALSGAPICCWDNSTRGLDAATALEFTKALKVGSHVGGMTQCVAIYQASQAIYDLFDKAVVLYEGRQIYYGPAKSAKEYFENMGWYCPPRQTTADFLTSVTNPSERVTRKGLESKVPRTPAEFEKHWLESQAFRDMQVDVDEYEKQYPPGGPALDELREAHSQAQSKHVPTKSPYTLSVPMQVKLCTKRAYQRLWNDKTSTIATIVSQIVMALIIGSLFFNTPETTDSFFAKGSVLFFAILLNALMSITEINGYVFSLLFPSCPMSNELMKLTRVVIDYVRIHEDYSYPRSMLILVLTDAQRPIVAKHVSFAFYHAFSEALAGIVADIPIKFLIAVTFNIILYFLGGLRREAGPFFIFFLFTFITMLVMSAIFRTLAAATKSVSQALALAGIMILAIVIYTGFTIQRSYM